MFVFVVFLLLRRVFICLILGDDEGIVTFFAVDGKTVDSYIQLTLIKLSSLLHFCEK